jgi:putative ABC transport system permease protein
VAPGTEATGALVRLRSGADRDAAAHRLGGVPGAAAYLDNAAAEATMRDAFAIMDVLVGVMLAFALVMAAALLFNAMSANVAERSVELGTLHAAGLSRRTLGRMVSAENLLLTAAGLPVGLVAGTLLGRWFMANYETQGYRWTLRLAPVTVAVAVGGILCGAFAAHLPILRRLRHLDVARIVRERAL